MSLHKPEESDIPVNDTVGAQMNGKDDTAHKFLEELRLKIEAFARQMHRDVRELWSDLRIHLDNTLHDEPSLSSEHDGQDDSQLKTSDNTKSQCEGASSSALVAVD